MCVVTQTIERIARELRATAGVLERNATVLASTDEAWAAEHLRTDAKMLRKYAKLLDGKDR